MARDENAMFGRGETWYQGTTPDANNLGGGNIIGQVRVFEDIDFSGSGSIKPVRSNQSVVCMAVRNTSGIALLPKRVVRLVLTAGEYDRNVDGYTATTAQHFLGVVDEWLPAAGCADDDICWVVIEGPTEILTDLAGGANNVISVGDVVVSLTAASSQATTAGRIKPQDLTGATALLGNELQNRIGRAMSAKTTANTNVGCLVNVRRF